MNRQQLLRDIFLGTIALVILYDQVFIARSAQPILIFLVIFLFGTIPALRGDKRKDGEYGPFVRIIMTLLGVKLPGSYDEADHGEGFPSKSQHNGPKQPPGPTHASSQASSGKSSGSSTDD